MTNITPASSTSITRLDRAEPAERAARPGEDRTAGLRREGDQVEFSTRARALAQLKALPPVRTDVVARVREEIANETYLTDDRVDLAIDALVDDLRLEI